MTTVTAAQPAAQPGAHGYAAASAGRAAPPYSVVAVGDRHVRWQLG